MRHPIALRRFGRLDRDDVPLVRIGDQRGEPIDLLFCREQHVAEQRGAAGPDDDEHVGESVDGEAEEADRPRLPFLRQRLTSAADDRRLQQRPREGVEAGRVDHDVEGQLFGAGPNPVMRKSFDRRPADVDQPNVVTVEGREIAAVHRGPSGAEQQILRRQRLANGGVVHLTRNLALYEVRGGGIGVFVEQDVLEGQREAEAQPVPCRFERSLSLGVRDFDGRARVGHEAEPARRIACRLATFGVGRLYRRVLVVGDGSVGRGYRVIGGALEHRELRRRPGDDGRHLDARRSGADDRDPLAGIVDRLLGPACAVDDPADELVLPRIDGILGRRQLADRQDQLASVPFFAGIGDDVPAPRRLVEPRLDHAGRQADVSAQVEAVGDMVDIAEDFGLSGVALAPAPFLLQLGREAIGIVVAFDVAASAGILIVIPDAADAIGRFQHNRRHTLPAQCVERPEAAESGANHQRIDLGRHISSLT
ncbi:hypothetical protein WR25_02702 [Diploscapter pachys]|uniref:Uncharacterized protein n=1 Tax=Diploscapter pachys TaxID=2018661 RepID=A0A2A2K1T1_9BILA|nr:hypothetical protein WR25_02702 [Diploscapter pachys]